MDSFVTHRRAIENLHLIHKNGLSSFIQQQKFRIDLLERLLNQYDDGKSKSFYCLAAALLPIEDIERAIPILKPTAPDHATSMSFALSFKERLRNIADSKGIELSYRKKQAQQCD